jgi:hypothetical protein
LALNGDWIAAIVNARLAPMHRWTAVLLAVVLPLSVLAAYLAIQVFLAVNGATNLIQAPPWLFGVRPEYWY